MRCEIPRFAMSSTRKKARDFHMWSGVKTMRINVGEGKKGSGRG